MVKKKTLWIYGRKNRAANWIKLGVLSRIYTPLLSNFQFNNVARDGREIVIEGLPSRGCDKMLRTSLSVNAQFFLKIHGRSESFTFDVLPLSWDIGDMFEIDAIVTGEIKSRTLLST